MQLPSPAARAPLAGAAIVIALALAQAAFSQSLYGDGAFTALQILESGAHFIIDPARLHAQWLNQGALVLAIQAGIRDTHTLSMIYTLGQVAIPAAAYALALGYARGHDLLASGILVSIAIAYLNGGFLCHGEYVWAYALATLMYAILLRDAPMRLRDAILLVACGALAVRVYEAFVFLGPLAFVMANLRLATDSPRASPAVQALLALFAFLAAAATTVSLWAIWFPRMPANAAGAMNLATIWPDRQFLVTLAAAAALALSIVRSRTASRIGIGVALACCAVLVIAPPIWAQPAQHYFVRAAIGPPLLALFVALAALRFIPRGPLLAWLPEWNEGRPALAAASLALVAALAVPFGATSLGWHAFLGEFREIVNTRRGVIALEDTPLVREGRSEYVWWWTNPSLSHVVAAGPEHAVIRNPVGWAGWQPFDPATPHPALLPYAWR
jgi:hypothetical protein